MSRPDTNGGGTAGDASAPSGPSPPPAAEDSLSRDEVFHILQNRRRRFILRYLAREDGPVGLREVADMVAAREHDATVDDLTSDERQRVYIALYQSHLPKLDEVGVVRYDRGRSTVERTRLADQLDPYLAFEDDEDAGDRLTAEPWHVYFAVAALLSLVVTGVALPTAGPTLVDLSLAALFVVSLFSVLTALMFVDLSDWRD